MSGLIKTDVRIYKVKVWK